MANGGRWAWPQNDGWYQARRGKPSGKRGAKNGGKGKGFGATIPGVGKTPEWACESCAEKKNWRCKTNCRSCGAPAPPKHLKEVMAEAAAAEKQQPCLAAAAVEDKAADKEGTEAASAEAEMREELLALQAALDSAKRGKMPEDVLAKMQGAVDAQRAKHRAAKPAVAQAKNLERSIEELEGKAERHKKKAAELRTEMAALETALGEQLKAEKAATDKLAEARKEAEALRAKIVEEAKLELEDDAEGGGKQVLPENPVDAAWLAQQKPDVIESFKRYKTRNAGETGSGGKGKAATAAKQEGAEQTKGSEKAACSADDFMGDVLVDALFADDEGDKLAFRELVGKRGRTLVEQAFDKVSAARKSRAQFAPYPASG